MKVFREFESHPLRQKVMLLEIDNFFHNLQYKSLDVFLKKNNLYWRFFQNPSLGEKFYKKYYPNSTIVKESPAFVHIFHRYDEPKNNYNFDIYSLFYNKLSSIFNHKIKIFRIQGNIGVPCPNFTHQYNCPHVDWENFQHNTLIYYLNTVDGDTILFEETYPEFQENNVKNIYRRCNPRENKAIIFDGFRYHASSPSTTNLRIVINVNFAVQDDI